MIVLVSLIVLLRGFPCFQDFSHGPSHPYISIFPLVMCVYVHLLHDLQQHTPNVTYVFVLQLSLGTPIFLSHSYGTEVFGCASFWLVCENVSSTP